jgi:hypothetical protein
MSSREGYCIPAQRDYAAAVLLSEVFIVCDVVILHAKETLLTD